MLLSLCLLSGTLWIFTGSPFPLFANIQTWIWLLMSGLVGYVFGDYSYGKLRLKGFYADNNKNARPINKLSYMEEYLKNYCAFNCNFFLIEKAKK